MNNTFNRIRAALEKEYADYQEKRIARIRESDEGLRGESTETRWAAYNAGEISREKAVEYAVKRTEKRYAKELAADLEKLEGYENAGEIRSITIDIEWKRSSVWGHCPRASVMVEYENGKINRFSGYASGCGYDKRSAAVAQAFNECAGLRKILCKKKEEYAGDFEYSNGNSIGYGAGYGAIPYWEGGVGINCFQSILEKCGFRKEVDHGTKYTDYYYYVKE